MMSFLLVPPTLTQEWAEGARESGEQLVAIKEVSQPGSRMGGCGLTATKERRGRREELIH